MKSSKLIQSACRYNFTTEEAHALAEQTLEKLKHHDVSANPIHFTLFFELLTSINPNIAEQVEHALQFNTYNDDSARVMFNALWSEIISHSLHSEEFSEIVNNLILYVDNWIKAAQSKSDKINAEVEQVSQLSTAQEMMDRLKSNVLPAIKSYQSETDALQEQIHESSTEIIRLKKELDKATAIAKTDELTNIPNRRGFHEIIENMMAEANKNQSSFALLLLDIDFFKKVNDTYGHLVGDSILRYLAKSLHNETKGKDSIARIGGEEFVAILPNTSYDSAIKLANTIREKIAARPLHVKNNTNPITLTVSIGVAMYQLNETLDSLFTRADKCLYMAKSKGRNRVHGEASL
ncbi:GGDEF domain-containing protein [Hydrogenovibrio sp. 3SP14C1]|uniref:GGDEF domain-containing protein n=1 Tax=Hydrogenovibrio sp. 3SP14C1 TaxID=3038774 RepID=UPI002415D3D9|nr:GGDEF domain-containing protein [Hydrogenovibrio sp. 3SP14C1]MDG4811692.1 GGDEF domain-containing protein [Hydrogenovibrio sp. 3SP14C1]